MQAYQLTLRPETAFGTPLVGDTLFGQICWGIVEQYGEALLESCLQGYTKGSPFLVVSDAFPKGYVPLPTLPSAYWQQGEETDRKKLKKRQWLPESALGEPSRRWQMKAKSSNDLVPELISRHSQPHNSLNRQTHTTGAGTGFAPYESEQIWYAAGHEWQIYLLLDEGRLNAAQLQQVLTNIGLSGYGRDASTGLGKFSIIALEKTALFEQRSGNAVFTLAASCPQGLGYDAAHSYYHTQTRFGRHGNIQATAGQPFKQPVLMAQTGAVFSGTPSGKHNVGQGITGISQSQPQAVQQGYAPALSFDLEQAN
ncbi:hypothetical protein LVJ83_09705 [Uruburuella testudinis]|uniref:CRISPR system Cms protein Csm4 n=1 Tax=Uruburuella testudinis TaxID=1282863 RepID=A0ABY4DRA0_9NEIS|nr:hypothetical protein [Uruburuella testudinis]UOO81240.1 hypothetical protein LVJ83_09705 [Uruburuella testudinis]